MKRSLVLRRNRSEHEYFWVFIKSMARMRYFNAIVTIPCDSTPNLFLIV